jgi:hypothetical protein
VARYFNDRFPVDRVVRGRVHARAVRFLDRSLDRERQYWTPEQSRFRIQLRNYVYGSAQAQEYLYKKKYREHNERVLRTVPPERLLVMNVTAGDGWANLCPFLGLPIPAIPFPHENKTPLDGALALPPRISHSVNKLLCMLLNCYVITQLFSSTCAVS